MHVIAGQEIPVLSALPGLFIEPKWAFSFSSRAIVPVCFDGTPGRAAGRPAPGLVRPVPSRRWAQPSTRWRARASPLIWIKSAASCSFSDQPEF